ncbi:MAG: methyltransferase domain-containing protein, partial [Chloroflexales bacterium]|nr:methyltransferase domain-containing protein [Chloroflexales bacterium]
LARRGYAIDAIELGENMAAIARRALASYPQAHVRVGTFEQADIAEGMYDLVTSATAWHWVDPTVRYVKAARALRPGGALAPFWSVHVHTDADGGFFEQVQKVYDRLVPELTQGTEPMRHVEQLPEAERTEIERSGLFGPVAVRRYGWDEPYTTARYIALLSTYSNHRTLPDERRQHFFDAIAALMDSTYGGRIVKGYAAMLYVARRT